MEEVEVVSLSSNHTLVDSEGLSKVTGLKAGDLFLAMERSMKCFMHPVGNTGLGSGC